jgi:hypothetical protein
MQTQEPFTPPTHERGGLVLISAHHREQGAIELAATELFSSCTEICSNFGVAMEKKST